MGIEYTVTLASDVHQVTKVLPKTTYSPNSLKFDDLVPDVEYLVTINTPYQSSESTATTWEFIPDTVTIGNINYSSIELTLPQYPKRIIHKYLLCVCCFLLMML